MKKRLRTIAWLAVAAAVLTLLAWDVKWDTFRQQLTRLQWRWAAPAVVLFISAQAMLAVRWVLLLRVQGVHLAMSQAVKLTFLGLFYNNVMPGAVGGDILKAWFVTRHSDRHLRVEAALTVLVDRLIGLGGILLVAAVASLMLGGEVAYEGIQIRWLVRGIVVGMLPLAALVLSRRSRQWLLARPWLQRMRFAVVLNKIDAAIQLYRRDLRTVGLSLLITVLVQTLALVAVWMLAQSLGLTQVRLVETITIMPVIWLLAAAIPVPGGLGVMEGAVTYLFGVAINPDDPKTAYTMAAALALLNRLMICTASLPGGLVPVFGGHLPKAEQMEAELAQNAPDAQATN